MRMSMRVATFIILGITMVPSSGWAAASILSPADVEGIFREVGTLPAAYPMGLARLGASFVVADRHRDECLVFEAGREVSAVVDLPFYEPAALTTDGELVIAADGETGTVGFLELGTGVCRSRVAAPSGRVRGMARVPDGTLWIAAKGADELRRIDPADGTILAQIPAPSDHITALAADGDRYLWAADSGRDRIYLVDQQSGYTVFSLAAPGPYITGLWLEDGTLWASDYQTDRLYRADVAALHGAILRTDERRSRVEILSELQNLGPGSFIEGSMVLAVPEDGPNQDLGAVDWSKGGRVETDQWGQRAVVYGIGALEPGESFGRTLEVEGRFYATSCKVFPHRVGALGEIPEEIAARYLADADKYRLDHPVIRETVDTVVGDSTNPWLIARKLYEFLADRINYQMIGGWDIAPTVIERGTGSCSEYTFAYVALCRAAGVPARYVGSVVVRGEDASFDKVYHRWAEIYLPGVGWIPVDVNAGDEEWQGDRAESFGGISNRFLITTRGGGGSDLLSWTYNVSTEYQTRGKANVREEAFAEWDVLE